MADEKKQKTVKRTIEVEVPQFTCAVCKTDVDMLPDQSNVGRGAPRLPIGATRIYIDAQHDICATCASVTVKALNDTLAELAQ